MPKHWLQLSIRNIITHLAADPAACSLFAHAVNDVDTTAFLAYLSDKKVEIDSRCQGVDLLSAIATTVASGTGPFGNAIPHNVIEANAARMALRNAKKNIKSKFLQSIGFTANGRAAMASKFEAIPCIQVERLPASYPPEDTWIYEDPDIGERWREHLESGPQPDVRNQRHPMMHVEPEFIVHDLDAEHEAVFYDSSGEIIAVACKNFCPDESVLPAIDGIIADEVKSRRSARVCFPQFLYNTLFDGQQLEDPGSLVQIGYSAGARSAPAFNWVRNLTRKLPDQVVANKDYQASSAFALFWNLCRDFLPEKIMGTFDVFLDHCNMVRMKSGQGAAAEFIEGEGVGIYGEYTVCIGDDEFIFKDAEMAPPSGVFGQNYSRCASANSYFMGYA